MTGIAIDSAGNIFASDMDSNLVVRISPAGFLTIVAGNGIGGFSGDGGQSTSASLAVPRGIATDAAGNLYIADFNNLRVRRVGTDGTITTVAGNGRDGVSGDGGPATGASLSYPWALAVDSGGNLYVADSNNHRIRKVDTRGIITTVAGSGPTGQGGGGFSGDGGPATVGRLNSPTGIAVDGTGNLYIADNSNNRVRRVSPDGIISTVAGNGLRGFSGDGGPATQAALTQAWSVALDGAGNLYILSPDRIRKVSPTGIISTVAGNGALRFSGDGGPATIASLNAAQGGLASDAAGSFYVADAVNYRIRRVNSAGTITTIAGIGPQAFGDGGPATSAALNSPRGLAFDGGGNLYIADVLNHRVRKVSSLGVISTVAGNGIANFSGDGGPATAAALAAPSGVAIDSSGNLYIADSFNSRIRKVNPGGIISTFAGGGSGGDGGPAVNAAVGADDVALDAAGNVYIAERGSHRVRKVDRSGVISTVAGNGTAGFSGDGGPAIAATLNDPVGIAVDAAGTLYVAELGNWRVRRVTPTGIISTVAGNGTSAISGDGGLAINAALGGPIGLALDGAGNLYITGTGNRVRKVDTAGIITTVAGGGSGNLFSGDGGPAVNAVIFFPTGLAFDVAGNLYIADTGNDRVRRVLVAPPSFSLAPASLSFTIAAGAPASVPQQMTVSSPVSGLPWNAQASTVTGGGWLRVSSPVGSTPGTFQTVVDASSLAPGTYQGTITVTVPLASPSLLSVPVQLTVTSALPRQLVVDPASLTYEPSPGVTNPPAQSLRISNAGAGTLDWTALATTQNGGNWLAVTPASGSASAASPAIVQLSASAAGLASGVYSGAVEISASDVGQSRTVPVTLLVAQATQTILLSQTGLLFTGVEGGGVVPSQTIGVVNTGRGIMNWTARHETFSGGNWLTISPASGRSDSASTQIPLVEVGVNLGSLRAGQYSGLVRIESSTANNSPQVLTVDLNVLPAGSNPGPLVRPTGLIFAARAAGTSPGSQTVRVATPAPRTVELRSGLLTFDGGNWLESQPRNAVISPADSRAITIQPTIGSLAPNVYRAALTLLFADGSSAQTVNILFVVVPPTGAATSSNESGGESESQCAPQRLLAVHRSLGSSFASSVGWPTLIEAQVVDDCGNPVTNASVVASFSSGDPPLPLASLREGIYVGTWRPVNAQPQVAVTVRATLAPLVRAEVQATVGVGSNPAAPALFSGGAVNGASFARGNTLAPGSIVSIFGRNLARGLNHAVSLPLEKTLGGATLSAGGIDVPLFFSSETQVNAQLPFELAATTRPQLIIKTRREGGGAEFVAVPETVTIAAVSPGIFSTNQQGTGQGAILDAQGRLVDSSAPVAAGEVVQVFCTGLGATLPAVRSGEAAPGAEPLARVVAPVEAWIGGQLAAVHFAGLAPGFVGLYQVNVEVPAGVQPGSAVSLVVSQAQVQSNTVTLAIR